MNMNIAVLATTLALLLLSLNPQILSLAQEESPFSIIFDGGSTGSRLHVFEFVEQLDEDNTEDIVRRGSFRVSSPLSAFASLEGGGSNDDSTSTSNDAMATAIAEHLMPALTYAKEVIPPQYYSTTRVYYQATAGMRLLTQQQQDDVYDAMYRGLFERDDFVFDGIRRSDIGTLSGELEGYYGAVAANYLKGTISAGLDLQIGGTGTTTSHQQHDGPYGALDMGGASTQIVFLPSSSRSVESGDEEYQYCSNVDATVNATHNTATKDEENSKYDDGPAQTCKNPAASSYTEEFPDRLDDEDFFSVSHLAYGVDQFRERLWNTWIEERKQQVVGDECDSKVLPNPCCFKGYEIEWEGYTLVGTGDTDLCVSEVQRLIPHPEEESPTNDGDMKKGVVGGVEHPPIRGKFFAMSLYFFTLDALRELSRPNNEEAHEKLNLSWPTPSIQELTDALNGLCSRSWKGDLEDIQHEAHAYTRPEVLPHRCLESVYMVTLLRDGFGFSPESRDITFTFLVDGSEVEWTLGMALALRAQQRQEMVENEESLSQPSSSPSSSYILDKRRKNDTMEEEEEDDVPETETAPTSSFKYMLYRLFDVVSSERESYHI